MADISLPQSRVYYRIAVENPEHYVGVLYHNNVSSDELDGTISDIRKTETNTIVSVEYVVVAVAVTDVTEDVLR